MSANRQLLEQIAHEVVSDDATIAHLGTGGFASTFKVVKPEPGGAIDIYALKVVDAAQADAERTDRELAALQRVDHPNVVGYRGTGVHEFEDVQYRWLEMNSSKGPPSARRSPRAGPGRCRMQ